MNGQELFLKDGNRANIWYCAECTMVATSKDVADNCCKKYLCKYCNEPVNDKHWIVHEECIEKNKIEKATKLEIWNGWVYYNDKYCQSVEELVEELEENYETVPECVYTCKTIPFPKIDIYRLLEKIEGNSYEEIGKHLIGVDDLIEAINCFNDANKDLVSYLPDETKMVRVKDCKNGNK